MILARHGVFEKAKPRKKSLKYALYTSNILLKILSHGQGEWGPNSYVKFLSRNLPEGFIYSFIDGVVRRASIWRDRRLHVLYLARAYYTLASVTMQTVATL